MKSKKVKEDSVNLAVGFVDGLIRFVSKTDALEVIPIAGTALKVVKLKDSLKEQNLRRKISIFIDTINDKSTEEERVKFSEKLKKDQDLRENLSGILFMHIDQYNDFSKPYILAKIFSCYITNKIRLEEFIKFLFAVGESSSLDLENFTQYY
ncbi:MAG: hypothetical protein F6K16_30165 [Symploca sp. SIO2B6]|nr:hypothetical protein [Symploca sp. SIO2B6]